MHLLKRLLTPQTPPPPAPARPRLIALEPACVLLIDKAAHHFSFLDRRLELKNWRDAAHFRNWKHDLCVKRHHGDLTAMSLEVLDHDGNVVFRNKIRFSETGRVPDFDHAGGIELPLLDRSKIKGARLLVFGNGVDASTYRQYLRLEWAKAIEGTLRPGDDITADHAAAITGGRQSSELHIASSERHRLEVTQTGTRSYAFARDLDRSITGVYLHRKFAPAGLKFYVGQHLTAQILVGPKGVQAHAIRTA